MTQPPPVRAATPPVVVRRARPGDLPQIAGLAAEHAAYERANPPAPGLADRLGDALFGPLQERLRLCCLVAETAPAGEGAPVGGGIPGSEGTPGGEGAAPAGQDTELLGYATCVPEFATWAGAEYLHMDCLYLRPGHRGRGIGRALIDAVAAHAAALGLPEVQWNTPDWNDGAIRFYDRLGATARTKQRYTLRTPSPDLTSATRSAP